MLSFDDAGRGQAKAGLHDVVVVLLGALVAKVWWKKKQIYFIWVDTIHSPIITTPEGEEPYPKGVTVFSLGLRNHLVYNKNTKQIFRYRNPNIFTFTTLIKKPLYLLSQLRIFDNISFFCKMARLIHLHYGVQND